MKHKQGHICGYHQQQGRRDSVSLVNFAAVFPEKYCPSAEPMLSVIDTVHLAEAEYRDKTS